MNQIGDYKGGTGRAGIPDPKSGENGSISKSKNWRDDCRPIKDTVGDPAPKKKMGIEFTFGTNIDVVMKRFMEALNKWEALIQKLEKYVAETNRQQVSGPAETKAIARTLDEIGAIRKNIKKPKKKPDWRKYHYKKGRVCAGCGNPILDKAKTKFCRVCVPPGTHQRSKNQTGLK